MPYTFSFITTSPGTFDPVIGAFGSKISRIIIDGATAYNSNSISVTLPAGTHSVDIVLDDEDYFSSFQMDTDGITGNLDFSRMDKLNYVDFYNNPSLTGVSNPTNSNIFFGYYRLQSTGISGSVDLSGINGLSSDIQFTTCTNLKYVKLPTNNQLFYTFNFDNCYGLTGIDASGLNGVSNYNMQNTYALSDLTLPPYPYAYRYFRTYSGLSGSIDFSSFRRIGDVYLANNSYLKQITFTESNHSWYNELYLSTLGMRLNGCGLTGSLDLSMLKGLAGHLDVSYNYNLNQISLPSNNLGIMSINMISTGLTGSVDISGLSGVYGTINISYSPMKTIINPTSSSWITYHCIGTGLTALDLSPMKYVFTIQSNSSTNLKEIIFSTYSVSNQSDENGNYDHFRLDYCGLTGSLDLSSRILAGYFTTYINTYLKEIVHSTSSQVFRFYDVSYCGLTGTHDMSGLNGIGLDLRLNHNSNLKNVNLPVTHRPFWNIAMQSCGFTNSVDLTPLKNLGGDFYISYNTSLKTVYNPTGSIGVLNYYANNSGLTGSLDLSGLKSLRQLDISGSSVSNIILATTSAPNCGNRDSYWNYPSDNWGTTYNFFSAYNCNLTGTLDMRPRLSLGGKFNVSNNPNLTNILNPSSSQQFYQYYAYSCGLSGSLDLSGLSSLAGYIYLYSNPNLTEIINPTSSRIITSYRAYSCNLNGTFSFTGLTNCQELHIYSNPNLENILNPTHNKPMIQYYAYSCNLGYIDFTTMPNLTKWNSCNIQLQNNNMTAGEVNHILYDLDIISGTGYSGRSINLGGTNAAPDGSSGGYDGTSAKTSLQSKGFTVTTN